MNVRPTFVEHPQTERPMTMPPRPSGGQWLVTLLYRLAVTIALATTVLRIVWHFSLRSTLDDAFMFIRYADHLRSFGVIAWNVPGPPTYGLTSPAFLLVVLPVRMLLDAPGAASVVSSAVSGMLFFLLLFLMLRRHAGVTPDTRRLVTLLASVSLMAGSYSLCNHFSSGMDTMFALAVITAIIIGHRRNEERPARWMTVLLGIASGLAFLVRPDLMIYTIGAPAVAVLAARDAATRKRMLAVIGIGLAVLGLELVAANAYFGLPLPLPFYAKGMHSYSGEIQEFYRYVSYEMFGYFAMQFAPLLLAAIVSLAYLIRRGRLRQFTPFELGLWSATLVFWTYYLFFVMQIMPHEARFYYPTLPALFLLATRSLTLAWEPGFAPKRWAGRLREMIVGIAEHRRGLVIATGAAAVLACGAGAFVMRGAIADSIARMSTIGDFDVRAYYRSTLNHYWYRLDELSDLPDDLVFGTTEVGMPAALNPGKRIVDLAGLNNTGIVRHGFSANEIFTRNDLDFFYMPHPHYTEMIRQIMTDPRFRERYEYFTPEQTGTQMGIAIRKDGKYYRRLHEIAMEGPDR